LDAPGIPKSVAAVITSGGVLPRGPLSASGDPPPRCQPMSVRTKTGCASQHKRADNHDRREGCRDHQKRSAAKIGGVANVRSTPLPDFLAPSHFALPRVVLRAAILALKRRAAAGIDRA
jgi:hypothetical protein